MPRTRSRRCTRVHQSSGRGKKKHFENSPVKEIFFLSILPIKVSAVFHRTFQGKDIAFSFLPLSLIPH